MFDRTKSEKKKKKTEKVVINGKTWDKQAIQDLIWRSDKAVYRALLRLYSFQTDEEKCSGNTKTKNGKGFSQFDAKELGDMAHQIKCGASLDYEQMYKARCKLMKYANQLLKYMKKQQENTLEKV